MQIKEITQKAIAPAKPPTPDQQRVKSLQTKIQADRQQLQAERDRQRKKRDAERLRKITAPTPL